MHKFSLLDLISIIYTPNTDLLLYLTLMKISFLSFFYTQQDFAVYQNLLNSNSYLETNETLILSS